MRQVICPQRLRTETLSYMYASNQTLYLSTQAGSFLTRVKRVITETDVIK